MKTRLFIILAFGLPLVMQAQSNNYPNTGNPTIYDYSPNIILQRNTNDGGFTQGIQAKFVDGSNNWFFGALHANNFIVSKGDYGNPLFSVATNGHVGIGTVSPRAVFDVRNLLNNGQLGTVLGRLSEGDYAGDGTYIGTRGFVTNIIDGKSFALEHGFYGQINSSIAFHRGQSGYGGFMSFSTYDNTEQMRITMNGDVGIGTTIPKEKLSVNGKIRAQEIKVETTNWPDYVFDQDYKILELVELERFIKINKHLPDIPSAKETETNGLELGEMNKLLLKKIEELTLHIIAQQKIIASQDKRLLNIENHLKK